jgi:hypothetical protein
MLALTEDFKTDSGAIRSDRGAVFRAIWRHRLQPSYMELARDAVLANDSDLGRHPDFALHALPSGWQNEVPSSRESRAFVANLRFLRLLVARIGEGSGKNLELLMHYLFVCMPGVRAQLRVRTRTCEFDVVGSTDGVFSDFRSELGRYFACECKDYKTPAGYPELAKFALSLLGVQSRFGVFVSPAGITGEKRNTDARGMVRRLHSESGVVIVVLDLDDLRRLSRGESFIELLQARYEQVRLDLA